MRGPIRILRDRRARHEQWNSDNKELIRRFIAGEIDQETWMTGESFAWLHAFRRVSFREAAEGLHKFLNPPPPELLIDEEDLPWTAKTLHE